MNYVFRTIHPMDHVVEISSITTTERVSSGARLSVKGWIETRAFTANLSSREKVAEA